MLSRNHTGVWLRVMGATTALGGECRDLAPFWLHVEDWCWGLE